MMDDDAQLLQRYARDGAEEAFAELVRRHLGLVYGSASRRVNGNAALAEEVTQTVFATLARETEQVLRRGTVLAGWLFVATRNAAANAMRAEARRVRREQEAFLMHEIETSGAVSERAWVQLRPELEAVMDELGAADRDAVLLRFFEGRPFGEVGAALHVSEDAARVRVNRALEKLRGLLAKRGVTSTAAALGGLLAGNAAGAAPAGMAASVTGAALAAGTSVAVAIGASAGAAVVGGTAGVSVGSLITFMSTTKMVVGVLSVIAAVAVGTAVRENAQRRHLQVAADAAADDAAKTLQAAEARLSVEVAAREAAEKRLAESKASPAPVLRTVSPTTAAASMDASYADPRYVQAMNRVHRADLPFTYGPLYRKLGLSAEQIAGFEKAMMEWAVNETDVLAAARSQGITTSDKSVATLSAEARQRSNDAIKAALGEENYREFQIFRKEGVVREALNAFFAEAFYRGTAFSAEQAEELTRLTVKNKRETKVPTETGSRTYSDYDWDAVQAGMSDLTAEQRALLAAYAEKRKAEAELSVVRRALQNKGAGK